MRESNRDRQCTDRHVDREQPGPWSNRQDAGGDGRSDRRCDRADRRVEPDATAEPAPRIDEAHQCAVDAHDAGRAEALDDARDGQSDQRIRQRAAQRCDGEYDQPVLIDAPIAIDVAKRGERQQRDRHRKLVGVHHPDRGSGAGIDVPPDRRQRHVGDRAVQHRERQAERDGQDRPVALREGNAVGLDGSDEWPRRLVRHHAGGWVAAQWRAISMRRVIQTSGKRLT